MNVNKTTSGSTIDQRKSVDQKFKHNIFAHDQNLISQLRKYDQNGE